MKFLLNSFQCKHSFFLNNCFYQDVVFKKHYNESPAVLVTGNHSTNGGNLNPLYNSISAWVEVGYIYFFNGSYWRCIWQLSVNYE